MPTTRHDSQSRAWWGAKQHLIASLHCCSTYTPASPHPRHISPHPRRILTSHCCVLPLPIRRPRGHSGAPRGARAPQASRAGRRPSWPIFPIAVGSRGVTRSFCDLSWRRGSRPPFIPAPGARPGPGWRPLRSRRDPAARRQAVAEARHEKGRERRWEMARPGAARRYGWGVCAGWRGRDWDVKRRGAALCGVWWRGATCGGAAGGLVRNGASAREQSSSVRPRPAPRDPTAVSGGGRIGTDRWRLREQTGIRLGYG